MIANDIYVCDDRRQKEEEDEVEQRDETTASTEGLNKFVFGVSYDIFLLKRSGFAQRQRLAYVTPHAESA